MHGRGYLYAVVFTLIMAACTAAPAGVERPPLAVESDNFTQTGLWPHIDSFTASSDNITPGENVTLRWDTGGGDSISITPGIGRVVDEGSVTVAPQATTKYELIVEAEKGRAAGWLTVNVVSKAAFMPDLVITGVTYNSGLLYYTVKNIGSQDAGPSETFLFDDSHMQRDRSWVDGLKAGEEKTRGFSNFNYSGGEVTICADGGEDVDESSEDNNCYVPVWGPRSSYDMLQYASRASWRGTGGTVQFGGLSDSLAGKVNKTGEITLEDGKIYRNVIEMSPPTESYAWVEGLFGESVEQWQTGGYMIPMEVPVSSHFLAEVGLARDSEGGSGVTFVFGLVAPDGKRNYWPGVKATYDGKLDSMDIDLSAYAGKRIMAILRVEAGADTEKNRAVWVEARITQ